MTQDIRPCLLMILDGWGINPQQEGNAVGQANTPNLNNLFAEFSHTQLICSGMAVGLPDGIMGNSEVGHLNIGAGRVVYQDLLRIDRAIEDRSFFTNPALCGVMDRVAAGSSTLHLMGLVSDGGVHSQFTHLTALLDMAAEKGLKQVCVHAILDGRDTPPNSGAGYLADLQAHMDRRKFGTVATVCGRYWAMDRDNRWDRIEKAFRLYTRGEGVTATDAVEAVKASYQKGETDEFVRPVIISPPGGGEPSIIRDGDGLIFFNFRADRAREILRAFSDPDFDHFERSPMPRCREIVCMTHYDDSFSLPVAFPPLQLSGILGEAVSNSGLSQLRIAETEKYAHVTYFFNGGEEKPFKGEDRCLVPSPREVATYDLKPEMSARKVTDELLARVGSGADYSLIVCNFANMDMVGHTGVMPAAIQAVETVDDCVGRIVREMRSSGAAVLITADHGNAEQMTDKNGNPHTAHTTNPVPFLLVDDKTAGEPQPLRNDGSLGDIAPTVLSVMGIDPPEQMTGKTLLTDRKT